LKNNRLTGESAPQRKRGPIRAPTRARQRRTDALVCQPGDLSVADSQAAGVHSIALWEQRTINFSIPGVGAIEALAPEIRRPY
jgi:hypothetical protein